MLPLTLKKHNIAIISGKLSEFWKNIPENILIMRWKQPFFTKMKWMKTGMCFMQSKAFQIEKQTSTETNRNHPSFLLPSVSWGHCQQEFCFSFFFFPTYISKSLFWHLYLHHTHFRHASFKVSLYSGWIFAAKQINILRDCSEHHIWTHAVCIFCLFQLDAQYLQKSSCISYIWNNIIFWSNCFNSTVQIFVQIEYLCLKLYYKHLVLVLKNSVDRTNQLEQQTKGVSIDG